MKANVHDHRKISCENVEKEIGIEGSVVQIAA